MSKLLLWVSLFPAIGGMLFSLVQAEQANVLQIGFLLGTLGLVLLFVLLNSLYVAAEFAVIGARPSQLEELLAKGNGRMQPVLDLLNSQPAQDRYIATAQIGITLTSLGLAMVALPRLAQIYGVLLAQWGTAVELTNPLSYLIALISLVYLHVVIGEMVPKSLARTDAPHILYILRRPMALSQTLLKYPVRALNGIAQGLLQMLRIPPATGNARVNSPEEIELLVTESTEDGLLNEEEQEMILNIFEFSERTVGQLMTPRPKVQAIPANISQEKLFKLVAESHHSRFPVYLQDHDHIVGILHLKDLVRQMLDTPATFNLRAILRPATAVPQDLPVETLLAAFKRQHQHMAIVLDEFGGMAGVVTLEDLVEEVVGEVRDEFDQEKEPYVDIGPGVIEVSGDYLLADFDERFWGDEDALPDVETVGGLLISLLGRPPQTGDEARYRNIHLKALATDRRSVSHVRLQYDPSTTADNI